MFQSNIKALRWLLILSFISVIFACKFFENEADQERKLECMQELSVSQETVNEMENADDPKDEYSCFFGCMILKEGIISEDGQLNKTHVDDMISEKTDEDEKKSMRGYFDAMDNELKSANDTCSAGTIFQKSLYNMKKMVKAFKQTE